MKVEERERANRSRRTRPTVNRNGGEVLNLVYELAIANGGIYIYIFLHVRFHREVFGLDVATADME